MAPGRTPGPSRTDDATAGEYSPPGGTILPRPPGPGRIGLSVLRRHPARWSRLSRTRRPVFSSHVGSTPHAHTVAPVVERVETTLALARRSSLSRRRDPSLGGRACRACRACRDQRRAVASSRRAWRVHGERATARRRTRHSSRSVVVSKHLVLRIDQLVRNRRPVTRRLSLSRPRVVARWSSLSRPRPRGLRTGPRNSS
jgi:hypothetical protein